MQNQKQTTMAAGHQWKGKKKAEHILFNII